MTPRSLGQLLPDLGASAGAAIAGLAVSGLALDSRQVKPGDAFFALRGTRDHGINFAAGAVARGARVVLAEAPVIDEPNFDERKLDVPVLWIDNLHAQVGDIAARFYDQPSRSLRIVGVTGTNGKTSTVQLIAQALDFLGHRPATIGTLGAGLYGHLHDGERTTPDAINVQRLLAAFRDEGADHVAMEVSSHALEQGRVAAVDFEVAAFTNLTRDHLDYHGSMQAYGDAKAKLFAWPTLKTAVINIDDAFGQQLAKRIAADVRSLHCSAAAHDADVVASAIVTSSEGLAFELVTPWGSRPIHSALLGRFNVANLLAVVACLGALGEPFDRIVDAVEALQPVNGRMNRLGGSGRLPLVVVDYAHTPDALEQALSALRPHCAGRLICVFGCGGERDVGKRPLMGAIAARLADVAIVTDDNPRGEDGDIIVAQIVAGMGGMAESTVERDRARAIERALRMAQPSDVVLIAGKGHETYQDGADGKLPFDDMAVARKTLQRISGEAA